MKPIDPDSLVTSWDVVRVILYLFAVACSALLIFRAELSLGLECAGVATLLRISLTLTHLSRHIQKRDAQERGAP